MTDLNELREQLKPIFWDVFDPDSDAEGNVQAALDKALPIIALAAVSDTTPSPAVDHDGHEWMSWEESGENATKCRLCGIWAGKARFGVACAPTPSEGERKVLDDAIQRALYSSHPARVIDDIREGVLREGFRLTPPAPVDREKLLAGLEVAMLGDTDGGLIDPDSDIPAGEMYRLAHEYLRAALAVSPSPARDEWEYEVSYSNRSAPAIDGHRLRGSAGPMTWSHAKQFATEVTNPKIRRRTKGKKPGEWESLPVTEEERDD